MAGIASFPELSLRHRPALFDALLSHEFRNDVVEARFGQRRGWIVIDPVEARTLLRRRGLPKARSVASREAVGGYPSLSGQEYHRARSQVVFALSHAAVDRAGMKSSLLATIGAEYPSRAVAPVSFTRWMLHHLTGGQPLEIETLSAGIAAATVAVEAAQAKTLPQHQGQEALTALLKILTLRVDSGDTSFLASLREYGWSTSRIVQELIVLALAGWESTAAAVTTARTLGLSNAPTAAKIAELLRLYPPSWLIVRQMTGEEPWGAAGQLAVVSPWLTHRSPAWVRAQSFDPERADTVKALPFGSGPRRCPADLYARTQIAVALEAFGSIPARTAHPALLGRRSAALIPDLERTIQ